MLIFDYLLQGGLIVFIAFSDRLYFDEGFLEKAYALKRLTTIQLSASLTYYLLLIILWKCIFRQDREDEIQLHTEIAMAGFRARE